MPSMTPEHPDEMSPPDLLGRAIRSCREPVTITPDFDDRLMARLRSERAAGRDRLPQLPRSATIYRAWDWLANTRSIRVRPLTVIAGGAIVAAILIVVGSDIRGLRRDSPLPAVATATAAAAVPATVPGTTVRFVLVAPSAKRVYLLGDFNHWDSGATPLTRTAGGGNTWATTVHLDAGRHVYAFVVDGTRWVTDPTAPRSLDDDFGLPSAVLTVVGGST